MQKKSHFFLFLCMITITSYRPEYRDDIVEMILNIQQNEFQVPITINDQPDLLTIPTVYQVNKGNFWVALSGNEVIGTIGLIDFGNDLGCIRKMFVKAQFRGKEHGTAQKLLDRLFEHGRNVGIKSVYLGTIAKLQAAIRFYERNGFMAIEKQNLPTNFPLMSVDTHFFEHEL
jgi:putative acetyltransferase